LTFDTTSPRIMAMATIDNEVLAVPIFEIAQAKANEVIRRLSEAHKRGEDVNYSLTGGIVEEDPGLIGFVSIFDAMTESRGVAETYESLVQQLVLRNILGREALIKKMPYGDIADFLDMPEGATSFTIPTRVLGLYYHLSVKPSHHVYDISGTKHVVDTCKFKHHISNQPHSRPS
jgi:hypothetical protein